MKSATMLLFAAAGLGLLAPVALRAQTPLSVEVQAGVAIPMGDFADDFATTGFGFGINAAYRVLPTLDVYAGYSWQRFGAADDGEFEDVDIDIDDSGFALGARLSVPGVPGLQPWVRGGVIFHQLKLSGSEDGVTISITSDRAVGFEAGGGLSFPVAPRVTLSPAVIYRTYTPEFGEFVEGDESISYIGLLLGGRISL